MARKRRRDKRRAPLTPGREHWLRTGELDFDPAVDPDFDVMFFDVDEDPLKLWLDHRDRVIADHVAEHPGTRPELWWRYDAEEPRKRIGGTGEDWPWPAFRKIFRSGAPPYWLNAEPADPPRFESELQYIERLDLWFPDERAASMRQQI